MIRLSYVLICLSLFDIIYVLFVNAVNDDDPDLNVFDPRPVKFQKYPNGIEVADRAVDGLPKVRLGARVFDLVNGEQFNDILQDSPDDIRPPSVIMFYDSNDATCMKKYRSYDWDHIAETALPSRALLFTARYDTYSAPLRPWYKFTPEMDLKARLNVDSCPQLVYAPRSCHGFLEWCSRGNRDGGAIEYVGCKDFKESCTNTVKWDGNGDMVTWIKNKVNSEVPPKIVPRLGSYAEQGSWLHGRDETTSSTHMRALYLSRSFPAFSPSGFKAMPIPKPFYDDMIKFYKDYSFSRRIEYWDSSLTQMNFVETPTSFLDLDQIYDERNRWANEYVKPLVEEWSGVKPLELTAFYGMREYQHGSFLRNHVDRIDTHVLSVTISLKKDPEDSAAWPLEVIQWSGDHVRYEHPGGTMVLYESSKLNHGRPYRNKGGIHVGCFCHFKPAGMHGSNKVEWQKIAAAARLSQSSNSERTRLRETTPEEPENPVYTVHDYSKSTEEDRDDDNEQQGAELVMKFMNKGDRPYTLLWISDNGEPYDQGVVRPDSQIEIGTYYGHKFGWAEEKSTTPIEGSIRTISEGDTIYKYAGPESNKKKPNKWAKYVREKLENELRSEL